MCGCHPGRWERFSLLQTAIYLSWIHSWLYMVRGHRLQTESALTCRIYEVELAITNPTVSVIASESKRG